MGGRKDVQQPTFDNIDLFKKDVNRYYCNVENDVHRVVYTSL